MMFNISAPVLETEEWRLIGLAASSLEHLQLMTQANVTGLWYYKVK